MMQSSPKPMRPAPTNSLFEWVDAPTVVKGLTPMQRQRQEDGTPHTRTGATALRPADPALSLRPELMKGSLVEKYDARPKQPKQDPEDPMTVVKAFMNQKPPQTEESKEMGKSVAKMQAAIEAFKSKTGDNGNV